MTPGKEYIIHHLYGDPDNPLVTPGALEALYETVTEAADVLPRWIPGPLRLRWARRMVGFLWIRWQRQAVPDVTINEFRRCVGLPPLPVDLSRTGRRPQ